MRSCRFLFVAALASLLVLVPGCAREESGLQATQNGTENETAAIIKGERVLKQDPIAAFTVSVTTYDELCTGVLIKPDLVLTAAHCFQGKKDHAEIGFGLKASREPFSGQERISALNYERHPNWGKDLPTGTGDLALVLLKQPAPQGTQPATLVSSDFKINAGDEIIVAGFGDTRIKSASDRRNSQRSDISKLNKTKLIVEGMETETEVKSDGKKTSPCFGDSGGPGLTQNAAGLFLWGIDVRSADEAPCRGTVSHTALMSYLDWIKETEASLRARSLK